MCVFAPSPQVADFGFSRVANTGDIKTKSYGAVSHTVRIWERVVDRKAGEGGEGMEAGERGEGKEGRKG